jgi:uncharacterized damage-inducible protein DinB
MRGFNLMLIVLTLVVNAAAQDVPMDNITKRYAAYNTWANHQMADWLRQAGEERMNREMESSFPTLHRTVMHLWGAETGWLSTIQNREWERPAEVTDADSLLDALLATSALFEAHVLSLSEKDFLEKKKVGKSEMTVEDIVHHVFNHATYHRGQLITMGRQVGLPDPPRTDYIYYLSLIGQ